ncbi:MAG: aspartate/glutamate racemase family protein, partial [Gammaproteobacteria bacterium]|nr:aspartate/glutamate racemase family protein [Gammaproteobacteria bacterium]
ASSLRVRFNKMPIVAMEPAVKPAVAATKSGVVGVLATVGTLESARFAALLGKFANGVKVVTQGCPGLCEVVERGDLHSNEARRLIERYTAPLLKEKTDAIILGCTHYPFLSPLIREVVGEGVALVDTGAAVARELKRRVEVELPPRVTAGVLGSEAFFTSGDAEQAARIMSLLWGREVAVAQLPEEFL